MTDRPKSYFEVHFRDPKEGEIVSLKATNVADSSLGLSFVSLSNFIFDKSSLVIKPSEEQLQKRLENVKSLHISIHSIISIEEKGLEPKSLTFEEDKSKLLIMPSESFSTPAKH